MHVVAKIAQAFDYFIILYMYNYLHIMLSVTFRIVVLPYLNITSS